MKEDENSHNYAPRGAGGFLDAKSFLELQQLLLREFKVQALGVKLTGIGFRVDIGFRVKILCSVFRELGFKVLGSSFRDLEFRFFWDFGLKDSGSSL